MSFFYLFPGQGSQQPGMGADFYEASPAAKEILDRAAAIQGAGFLDLLFSGTQEDLNDTRAAQVALLSVGVAIAKHLEASGLTPAGCAGHSLGEIPALVVTGAIDFEDAFHITRERARLMAEEAPPGAMAAVMGLEAAAIEAALPEGAEVANFNGPGQTIISGTVDGIAAAGESLKAAGAKRVLPLKVSGAFHSSLMTEASAGMRRALEGVAISSPKLRFVSSVSAADETEPERIRELLWKQLTSPVRWTEVLTHLGAVDAAELGPGKVLQGIAKRMDGAPAIQLAGSLEAANALTE